MSTAERSQFDYLLRETAVSAGINATISIGFLMLVFTGHGPIPVRGPGNFAFDFVPQSFAIGMMATLVPGLLCRKAIAAGCFGGLVPPTAASVLVAAFVNGLTSLVIGAGLCALVLLGTKADDISWSTALAVKMLYGAMLGAAVTSIALRRMLVGG